MFFIFFIFCICTVSIENTPNFRGPPVSVLHKGNLWATYIGNDFHRCSDGVVQKTWLEDFPINSLLKSGLLHITGLQISTKPAASKTLFFVHIHMLP